MNQSTFNTLCDSVKTCQNAMLKNLHYDKASALTSLQYAITNSWDKLHTAERDAVITAVMEVFKKIKKGESVWEQEFIRL